MNTPQTSARHRPDGARHRTAPGPLLGRHEERQALDNLLDALRDGLSGALVLTGEAGIGKTRLLDYAAEAAVDLRTVRVSGMEAEARLGFAALHRLLLPFLDRLERLPGPQRDVLGSAFGLRAGPPADRFLAGLAALTLLADAAVDQPLICLVDDAQWLDRESMEVLGLVGRRLHADDIGLVLAVRDGPAGDPSGTAAFDGLPALRVTGLSEPDATVLLGSTRTGRPSPLAVGRIVAETGGNPLALIEFGGELTSAVLPLTPLPIGPRLEAHFLRQVRALPRETQELLLVASLAPSDDPAVLWRAAAALGLAAQALDPAVNDGILSRERHPAFRHPLIRSAVHAGADPAQRRRVHEALAAATDRATAPDRRAWHLAEAAVGLDEEVAAELERASERARSRGGYAAQGIFLARAAELTPDPHARSARLFAAARAHLVIGDAGQAQAALDQAVPGLQAPAWAVAQRLRAAITWLQGQVRQAPAILLAAVPEARRFDERLARDMVFEALVAALLAREHTAGVTLDELARTVVDMDWDPALPTSVQDLVAYAITMRITEGYPRAVPWLLRAADALIADDFTEIAMPIALIAYTVAEELWDDRKFKTIVDRLTAFSRARGALHALNVTLHSQAVYAMWGGRFAAAEAYFDEADEIVSAIGMPAQRPGHRVELLAWQGRETEARAAADVLIHRWGGQFGFAVLVSHAHHSLAVLELGLGHYKEALAWAVYGYANDCPGQGNLLLPDVVEAAVRSGDLTTAAAALDRLSERASLAGTPWALGLLARCRALSAADEDVEALYRESIDLLGRTGIATELARTHLLYGEWLRRRKRRTEARAQLRTAHDMFTGMGAEAFAERARAELLATGEHARSRTAQTDHELTPRERQVAVLASGSTNTEIATRLFLTVSTVEYHLNKVFRKLDITSRRQLPAALRDRGQTG